jgi:hypothetical protein
MSSQLDNKWYKLQSLGSTPTTKINIQIQRQKQKVLFLVKHIKKLNINSNELFINITS